MVCGVWWCMVLTALGEEVSDSVYLATPVNIRELSGAAERQIMNSKSSSATVISIEQSSLSTKGKE